MGMLRSVLIVVLAVLLLVTAGCFLRRGKERSLERRSEAAQRGEEAAEQEPVLKKFVLKSDEGKVFIKEVGQEEPEEAATQMASDEKSPESAVAGVSGKPSQETPQARAQRLHSAGMGYFNRQMYDDAIHYFTDAIELSPAAAEPYYYRARSRVLLGADEQDVEAMLLALEDLDAALELDAQYYDALVERARMRVELAHLSRDADLLVEGIADCTAALELQGDSAELLCFRGVAKEYLGELKDEPVVLEQAVLDLSRGLELDPNDGQAYFQRGYILGELYERYDYDMKFLDGSVEDFRRACELGLEEGCGYADAAEELLQTVSAGQSRARGEVASTSAEREGEAAQSVPQAPEGPPGEASPPTVAREELREGEHRVFMVIAGSSNMAEEIQQMLDEGVDVATVASRYKANSEVTTVKLSELKDVFQQHLEKLEVGKSTPIIEDGGYYYIIHLLQ